MLRSILKKIVHHTYRPWALWYTGRDRYYSHKGIRILVKKGVFHPGLFFSTGLLLSELKKEKLENKTVLELGAGSGLIAVAAALDGAMVTATDINPAAVENIRLNIESNAVSKNAKVLLSDLFDQLPAQKFDYILINPPYYARTPQTDAEKAWFCGAEFEYFEKLFAGLAPFVQPNTQAWLSLSQDCKIDTISSIAANHNWQLQKRVEKTTGWEKHFIFRLLLKDQ